MKKDPIIFNNRKFPLRGIITEIAEELGISEQSASNRILRGNIEILKIYHQKKAKREREYAKLRVR